jgi:glycerophosphoryl diester phosphodiesterase
MELFAHRGCSARETENTMAAFRAAVESGADGIETDVRLALDGSLWLFHDDKFSRLAGRAGSIETMEAKALHEVRLKRGERLPLLDELLALLHEAPKPTPRLNLELKGSKKTQRALATEIAFREQAGDFRDLSVMVTSFKPAALRELRKRSPAMALAPLWNGLGRFSPVLRAARKLQAEAVHFAARAVTRRRLAAIHKAGLLARVYTVNDPKLAKKLAELGVDGIFTDDPGAMRV